MTDINRDAVLAAIAAVAPAGMELSYDGIEDKYAAAYVEGVHAAHDAADQILARVQPDRDETHYYGDGHEHGRTVEGRDWVGNPDGTLIYWQQEADEARAKLHAIQEAVYEAKRRAPWSFEYLSGEVQAILDGTGHGQGSA